MIFLESERMAEGPCQSNKHWNCFKGDAGENSESQAGARFSKSIDTILN